MKTLLSVRCLLLILSALPSIAQNPCDPLLIQPKGNPYGYRLRGDHCEGVYVQEVSGAPLTIVSWTESFEDYDLTSSAPLLLQWDGRPGDVRLRAQGMRRRLYFRMDAIRTSGSKSFSWTPDLLAAVNIPKMELGILGYVMESVAGTEHEIYLPLRVTQNQKQLRSGTYHLVVIPGTELKELFLTVAAATSDGRPVVKNGEPLGYGYYPPERPVEIPISGLSKPGIYHVELGATFRSGGAATSELWFYHPPK
jgi:hypothetical protein